LSIESLVLDRLSTKRSRGSPVERRRSAPRHGLDYEESKPTARSGAEDGKVGARDQATPQRHRSASVDAIAPSGRRKHLLLSQPGRGVRSPHSGGPRKAGIPSFALSGSDRGSSTPLATRHHESHLDKDPDRNLSGTFLRRAVGEDLTHEASIGKESGPTGNRTSPAMMTQSP